MVAEPAVSGLRVGRQAGLTARRGRRGAAGGQDRRATPLPSRPRPRSRRTTPTPSPADAEKAIKVMGLDDTKVADPKKNPLEKSLDNLLDKIE